MVACSDDPSEGAAFAEPDIPPAVDAAQPPEEAALPVLFRSGEPAAACRLAEDPIFFAETSSGHIGRFDRAGGVISTVFEAAVAPLVDWPSLRGVVMGRGGVPNAFALLDPESSEVVDEVLFEGVTGRPFAFGHHLCALIGSTLHCRVETASEVVSAEYADVAWAASVGGRLLLTDPTGYLSLTSSTGKPLIATGAAPAGQVVWLKAHDTYWFTQGGVDALFRMTPDGELSELGTVDGPSVTAIGRTHLLLHSQGVATIYDPVSGTRVEVGGPNVRLVATGQYHAYLHDGADLLDRVNLLDGSRETVGRVGALPTTAALGFDEVRLYLLHGTRLSEWSLKPLGGEATVVSNDVAALQACARCHLMFVADGDAYNVTELCSGWP